MKLYKSSLFWFIFLLITTFLLFVFMLYEKSSTDFIRRKALDKITDWSLQDFYDKSLTTVPVTPTLKGTDPDIVKVLDVVGRMENKKPLLVTVINNAYLPFTYSWLCNTKFMDVHKQVLLITTDAESKEKLQKSWPNVTVVAISGQFQGDQVYSQAGYVRLMIRRTQILLAILEQNIEIFLFEVDCLWVKNPVPYLKSVTGYDMIVNHVSQRPSVIAGGFLYMFPTKPAKSVWNELNKRLQQLEKSIKSLPPGKAISEGQNDQIFLSNLVFKKFDGLKAKFLSLEEFADGKWYSWPEKKRLTVKPYVINNNWVLGNKRKVSRAKQWGHWFINEDNSCNIEKVNNISQTYAFL